MNNPQQTNEGQLSRANTAQCRARHGKRAWGGQTERNPSDDCSSSREARDVSPLSRLEHQVCFFLLYIQCITNIYLDYDTGQRRPVRARKSQCRPAKPMQAHKPNLIVNSAVLGLAVRVQPCFVLLHHDSDEVGFNLKSISFY
jgi:hypothetical protein